MTQEPLKKGMGVAEEQAAMCQEHRTPQHGEVVTNTFTFTKEDQECNF